MLTKSDSGYKGLTLKGGFSHLCETQRVKSVGFQEE
jgi:hypothetical protein